MELDLLGCSEEFGRVPREIDVVLTCLLSHHHDPQIGAHGAQGLEEVPLAFDEIPIGDHQDVDIPVLELARDEE